MKKLRPVIYSKQVYRQGYYKGAEYVPGHWEPGEEQSALFHMFYQFSEGMDDEGNYGASDVMAVIEMPDGKIKEVQAQHIRFTDRKEEKKG